jgi:hypothetical protein
MARQCALQSFVILDTVLHKNPTIQLQLIKKINLQQLTKNMITIRQFISEILVAHSISVPALVLPFSADHRASGVPNNPLFSMNREN